MTNLNSILKSRDVTLSTNVCLVKDTSFSSSHVWMWELDYTESWVQRLDAFELWCWRRLLRVPWATRRSNQSILNEIRPEYSLEGLMLRLKLQYFGHLMWRTNSLERPWCWEGLEAGGEGDDRDKVVGWHHQLNGYEFDQALEVGDGQESWGVLQSMGLQRVRHN